MFMWMLWHVQWVVSWHNQGKGLWTFQSVMLANVAKRNYKTTKREGLGMIFAVRKFSHYLLSNKFMFFIDHQALLYLVNKPCNTRRIVRLFLILLEFDFTVVVKQGKTHLRADHLSRLTNREKPEGINDELLDTCLFSIEMVPKWSK